MPETFPTTNARQTVWLYREPWRSLYLVALLALLGAQVVRAVGGRVDAYPHQILNGILISSGLLLLHVTAAYVPARWREPMATIGLVLALGMVVWVFVG